MIVKFRKVSEEIETRGSSNFGKPFIVFRFWCRGDTTSDLYPSLSWSNGKPSEPYVSHPPENSLEGIERLNGLNVSSGHSSIPVNPTKDEKPPLRRFSPLSLHIFRNLCLRGPCLDGKSTDDQILPFQNKEKGSTIIPIRRMSQHSRFLTYETSIRSPFVSVVCSLSVVLEFVGINLC